MPSEEMLLGRLEATKQVIEKVNAQFKVKVWVKVDVGVGVPQCTKQLIVCSK